MPVLNLSIFCYSSDLNGVLPPICEIPALAKTPGPLMRFLPSSALIPYCSNTLYLHTFSAKYKVKFYWQYFFLPPSYLRIYTSPLNTFSSKYKVKFYRHTIFLRIYDPP